MFPSVVNQILPLGHILILNLMHSKKQAQGKTNLQCVQFIRPFEIFLNSINYCFLRFINEHHWLVLSGSTLF